MSSTDKTARTQRILIVDGDAELRRQLSQYFGVNGFQVHTATGAAMMEQMLKAVPFDLILLDLNLPDACGRTICHELAQKDGPRVIMTSATNDPVDRILCLELGADDYVLKPLDPRELLARVRAVLRRGRASTDQPPLATYEFHGFRFDVGRRLLHTPDGRALVLRPQEVAVLSALLQRPGQVLSRDTLVDLVCREDPNVGERAIDTQISRLRRKLQAHGQPVLIRTVYGLGYVLDIEPPRPFALQAPAGIRPDPMAVGA